ncbi:MAG: hypothetical protein ACI8T1_005183 [Verrucomicrobiales bacterium]|jgi:hypothetical protein
MKLTTEQNETHTSPISYISTVINASEHKVAGRVQVMKTKVLLHWATALEASHRVIWERCVQPALQ